MEGHYDCLRDLLKLYGVDLDDYPFTIEQSGVYALLDLVQLDALTTKSDLVILSAKRLDVPSSTYGARSPVL